MCFGIGQLFKIIVCHIIAIQINKYIITLFEFILCVFYFGDHELETLSSRRY